MKEQENNGIPQENEGQAQAASALLETEGAAAGPEADVPEAVESPTEPPEASIQIESTPTAGPALAGEAAQGAPEVAAAPAEPVPPESQEPVYPEEIPAAPAPNTAAPAGTPAPDVTPGPGGVPIPGGAPMPNAGTFPGAVPMPNGAPVPGAAPMPYAAPTPFYSQPYPPAPYPVQGAAGYYPQPAQGPQPPTYPGGYYAPVPNPPYTPSQPQMKKKKPLALKVFLWLASLLAAGALLGCAFYIGMQIDNTPTTDTPPTIPPSLREYIEEYIPPEESMPEEPEEPVTPEITPVPGVDVTPNTEGIAIRPRPAGQPMDAQEAYERVVKSTVAVSAILERNGQESTSNGTGIIATADGYIITNSHVVLNSKSAAVRVTTYDGQEYDAVVVGVDRTTDLAVIKTNDHGFTPAEFGDADDLSMGEWVLAVGNPGGTRFANSVTRGIISGLDREVGRYSANGMTYIQTDAAINPGNSGGPLVNLYGQVVGINSSKIITENYESMGFAIPVSRAKSIIDQLLAGGYIQGRTRLGIMCVEVAPQGGMLAQDIPAGLMITEFSEDSAFKGTEAREYDIIIALDGEAVASLSDVSNLLAQHVPGDQVEVTLYRAEDGARGEELTVTITLLEDKGETQN